MSPEATHAGRAAAFLSDVERSKWHDESLWFLREKRDLAMSQVPEWESLRSHAAAIKNHALDHLAELLESFEEKASALGAIVHWAETADDHNRIVHQILSERGITRVAKSKSMLTEECHLNPYLAARGIEVTDTDLGERIVQLRKEPPSHIVMPAIHLRRAEIGELFEREMGTAVGETDPQVLVEAARGNLRGRFLEAEAGITGVNFAIAETGGFVVCTNEGNADLGTSIPKVHIACMGLEKVIPELADLPFFLRLLARSATGQAITAYTSHFHGPRPGGELHIVIVDAGRSRLLESKTHRSALACIRCAACMNTCPVYRRSGGHAYGATVPGPIGSILAPTKDPAAHADLPFACTLCGSCGDVCPVKIDLPHQLLALRSELTIEAARESNDEKRSMLSKRLRMNGLAFALASPGRMALAGRLMRWGLRHLPKRLLESRTWNPWARGREMPIAPEASFREQYARLQQDRRLLESPEREPRHGG